MLSGVPIFLSCKLTYWLQIGREEAVLKEWLHCQKTKGGLLVAVQCLGKRPVAVKQMVDEWLDHYRRLQTQPSTLSIKSTFSSDGESDDEWEYSSLQPQFTKH